MSPFILIVEDHRDLRDLLTTALTLHGYQTKAAADGSAALLFLWRSASTGHVPALILLDLELPGMDGYQFLARLQGPWLIWPRPRLILMTASSAAVSLPYPHLRKPFQVRDLLILVERVLAGRVRK